MCSFFQQSWLNSLLIQLEQNPIMSLYHQIARFNPHYSLNSSPHQSASSWAAFTLSSSFFCWKKVDFMGGTTRLCCNIQPPHLRPSSWASAPAPLSTSWCTQAPLSSSSHSSHSSFPGGCWLIQDSQPVNRGPILDYLYHRLTRTKLPGLDHRWQKQHSLDQWLQPGFRPVCSFVMRCYQRGSRGLTHNSETCRGNFVLVIEDRQVEEQMQ